LGFPLTISAASDTGPDAPTRVSVVATTGYLAFLVGPPLLGYLVVAGFEPLDLLQGVVMLVEQKIAALSQVENQYRRVVPDAGN
ncbi:hypothetical protein MJM28_31430, partial [Salmonella enterica subsp. enterica serovar Montevideo]|nr:hypothetical protein [Salmonella enterica subsp. enterica serovar Montevideo]